MTEKDQISGTAGSDPAQAFSPLLEARQLVREKRYHEAHALARSVAERDPDQTDAYYVLGIIAYEHRDFVRALKLFEVAVQKGHPEPGPHVQAARCLVQLSKPKEALAHIEAAKMLNPSDNFTLSSIGVTLSWLDRHSEAVTFHRKATQVSPDNALSFFNLGSSLQFVGDFDGAKDAYRACLKLSPGFAPALAHLTLITKQTAENNDLPALEAAWQKRHPADTEGGLQIAQAIAKVYEDLGEPEPAMAWFDKGKALVRQVLPDRRDRDRTSFEAAKTLARTLQQKTDAPADGPLFIVGLPRSGTTLVDRILSSHSQVIAAGERSDFGTCLHRAIGIATDDFLDPQVIARAAKIDLSVVGKRYIDSLRAILNSTQRFTDKLPVNLFFVPAILAALPSARVVCLRRHPADSALSIYRQLFTLNAKHYRFAYDLESLAEYVAEFNDLVEAYVSALPASRFTVVDYETLIDNPEAEIRRLLEFSGLSFEQACLDFQDNPAPVATASVAQVRQPIYTSSRGRWKRYEAPLRPALRILRERGWLAEDA
ncbi:MAG: sulfotransferase [Hyphomonas sp.]|nr:sulfotransferase [Hyphomonas sp.]